MTQNRQHVRQETGKTEKALSQYRRFLELWRNTDNDLPELIDARRRLEGLPRGGTQ